MESKKHIHGFRIPEDYFDTLQDRIMQNVTLDTLPKETGMQVPEDYFEHLESRIVANCSEAKIKRKPKVIRLNNWWYAAAVACSITLGLWLIPENTKENPSPQTLVKTEYSLENYMEDMVLDMPESSLYNLIDNTDYVDSRVPFNGKINKEDVEEYLMENLDLSTLLSYE